jgi:hypothetical protein
MLILQTPAAETPLLPWWVLYVAVLAITWGTWKAARAKWWAGCLTAALGWFFVFITAALTLPTSRPGLILLVTFAPVVGFVAALLGDRKSAGPRRPGAPRGFSMPREVMQGQPNARSVMKSKIMPSRFVAGMPRDSLFVARVTHVAGMQAEESKPVDLFVGGGQLWVAPLAPGSAPLPIALRDLLRVDVWPEGDQPPTLRVSWSPPSGELTRELVLGAIPNIPGPLVGRQLGAIAGAVTDAMQHDERTTLSVGATHEAPRIAPPAAPCPRCGTPLAEGQPACPRCGLQR